MRQRAEERSEHGQQRRRHDERPGAAVAQHVVVIARLEQRVAGNGHEARLDAAEEDRREVDSVVQAHEHALLALKAQADERVRATIDALRELAERVRSMVVDVGDLRRPPGREVALDEVVRGVVFARDLKLRRAKPWISARDLHLSPAPRVSGHGGFVRAAR